MKQKLELLAPAGNMAMGMAAINHGADAVYIGAPKFSARASAGNDMADIARLIEYAHLYYAKVYVALNTILTDAEIPQALKLIQQIYQIQADGVIIQDVGLLELDLPPIRLIASTQMNNTTPEKVLFLESVGFSRVILARELSVDEIKVIRQQTHVELETFVHGALCVSFSGQCYMSQAVTGRSGNRGVCAQPCRSRYCLTDADGNTILNDKYLLSLKDLNLIQQLPDLIEAGVTSFKIEGRYKDIDYVKNVTACYRMAVDRYIAGHDLYCRSSSGRTFPLFTPDLDKTFNRGYTRYFIYGRREKTGSIDTQKSVGKFVGTVTQLKKDHFIIKGEPINNGDGLCFFTAKGNIDGFKVDQVKQNRIYPNRIKKLTIGTRLYRNHDQELSRILKKPSSSRKIDVFMHFNQQPCRIRVDAEDEDGNSVSVVLDVPFEMPKNAKQVKQQIRNQLLRTGNTPYDIAQLTIDPENPGFLPVKTLNQIRRMALESLSNLRLEKAHPKDIAHIPNNTTYPEKELDFKANVLNQYAGKFYERHGRIVREPAFETGADPCGKTVMTTRYCLLYQIDACLRNKKSFRNIKQPLLLRDNHHRYNLTFDCEKCRMQVTFLGQAP